MRTRSVLVLSGVAAVLCGAAAPLRAAGPNDERQARSLAAVAESSARPAICRDATEVWQRARVPGRSRLCGLLTVASARLRHDPASALTAATEAQRAAPIATEPLVMQARALLALGKPKAAREKFEAALSRAAAALQSPASLHALARARVLTNEVGGALSTYRKLVPRAHLISSTREREKLLIEAALVAQVASPTGAAEARAYATEARRGGPVLLADFARGALALALDRSGHLAEARAVAREAEGPWALIWLLERVPKPRGRVDELRPVLPAGEEFALVATLAEPFDREIARDAWEEYIEALGEEGPRHLLEHARGKLSMLGGN